MKIAYIKKTIINSLLGMCFSVFLNQFIIILLIMNQRYSPSPDNVIFQFTLSSLIGLYCGGITTFYMITSWSRLKRTTMHLIFFLPFFPLAYYAGWLPTNSSGVCLYIGWFVCWYIIIWLISYFNTKKTAKAINDALASKNTGETS